MAARSIADELATFAVAADPGDRLLILRAARDAYSPGMAVTPVCADLGDEAAPSWSDALAGPHRASG